MVKMDNQKAELDRAREIEESGSSMVDNIRTEGDASGKEKREQEAI